MGMQFCMFLLPLDTFNCPRCCVLSQWPHSLSHMSHLNSSRLGHQDSSKHSSEEGGRVDMSYFLATPLSAILTPLLNCETTLLLALPGYGYSK